MAEKKAVHSKDLTATGHLFFSLPVHNDLRDGGNSYFRSKLRLNHVAAVLDHKHIDIPPEGQSVSQI